MLIDAKNAFKNVNSDFVLINNQESRHATLKLCLSLCHSI